jgi:hypothetical protein
MKAGIGLVCVLVALGSVRAVASPTGLNVIPTTDIVQTNCWIFGLQNQNIGLTDSPFYRMPVLTEQTQYGLASWLEAGIDYAQTPDVNENETVFNAKGLLHAEDQNTPNIAAGVWNVAQGQTPGYYLTVSKTLNYAQEQYERFRAHHRRNRKVLGRRVHLGMMLSGRGILQPFAGTDLQITDNTVFQADWVSGVGNSFTAGVAYVLWDQRTVITPAILIANDGRRFNGISINIGRQFNL